MDVAASNLKRRRFLLASTAALGTVAAGGAAAPFFLGMLPGARARAAGAPVEVDLSGIEPGMLLRTEWRGMPVWVLHRTQPMLDSLASTDGMVVDPHSEYSMQPAYCRSEYRSIRLPWLVVIAICTHLGCIPLVDLSPGPASGLGPDWPGGFFCPCHGSKYDLAGRVFKDMPAPRNLSVPRYAFAADTRLTIGADEHGS